MKRLGPRPIARSIRVRGDSLALALNLGIVLAYGGLVILAIAQRLTWMADFTNYYTGAVIIRKGLGGHLYDLSLQTQVQQQLLGGRYLADGLLPFNRPPHAALLLTPLTFLPLEQAYLIWLGVNVMLWSLLLRELWAWMAPWGNRTRILALVTLGALPSLLSAFVMGTFSIVVMLILWNFYKNLRCGEERKAGLWLALGSVHPVPTLFPLLMLIGARRRQALMAWAVAILAISIGCTLLLGWSVWPDFLRVLQITASAYHHLGVIPENMYNLKGTLTIWLGYPGWRLIQGLTFFALVAGSILTLFMWRGWTPGQPDFELRLGLTVLAGLLLSPHLNPQDGLLMGLPALWLYAALRESGKLRRAFGTLAALSPAVFLFGEYVLGTRLGIRIPVLGMIALAVGLVLALRHHGARRPHGP